MTRPLTRVLAHPLDDVFVLTARPLRPSAVLEDTPRFRDDRWSLAGALLQRSQSTLVLSFADISPQHRLTAKELCYTMLSGTLPPGERRPALNSVRFVLKGLKFFFAWLETRPASALAARSRLVDLTASDLTSYQQHLTATIPGASSWNNRRAAVGFLWRYRATLAHDRLLFDPRRLDGWAEARHGAAAENATDRIPEQIHGPLLAWALRFVDEFADDIFAADQQWRALRTPPAHPPGRATSGATAALRRLLDEHLENGRPLPGHQGKVNIQFLARSLGCDRKTLRRSRAQIDAVAATVGIGACTYFTSPIHGELDGNPWLTGITTSSRLDNGLATLARMMHIACYVVIAFLSGMRDGEIKHLKRGCLNTRQDAEGKPYRWQVTSLAFKGETEPTGVEATWIVGAPAARAIAMLEQLQSQHTDLLFARLPHSASGARSDRDPHTVLTSDTTNIQLNEFVRWINNYCARHRRSDPIPLHNNKNWMLTSRQFRRTLAWFIARRPGGAIAGAIGYRHLSVHMFEGYAGTSDSGFRAEVEAELALARGEHLLTMIDTHEHHNLAGPAADEATRRLAEFREQATYRGQVITDTRRLQRLMTREDPAIYPDKYVTCVHKHATALCQQRQDSRAQLLPDPTTCKPLACRNVALTTSNIDNLADEISTIDDELARRPLLPPLLQQQLRTRRHEIVTFLDRHRPEKP